MKPAEIAGHYSENSKRASEVLRTSAITSLAALWLLHGSALEKLSVPAKSAAYFLLVGLIFDSIQYVVASRKWYVVVRNARPAVKEWRQNQRANLAASKPEDPPPEIAVGAEVLDYQVGLFVAKIALFSLGFVLFFVSLVLLTFGQK